MTMARRLLVDESLTPWYHCISRAVRRAFLCGVDPVTGRDFSHRKAMIEAWLETLCGLFAVDCAGFAVMDNHLHLLLRLDSRAAGRWSDEEVARRWSRVFPPRATRTADGAQDPEMLAAWIAARASDWRWVAEHRARLASLSWFMKCLKEPISRAANKEDGCTGAFWEGRFRSIAVLDEESLLATCAYIDLNPVAAGIAKTPEGSRHTSLRARLDHCQSQGGLAALKDDLSTRTSRPELERGHWLLPIEDRRQQGETRAGLLDGFNLSCYLRLVDWTSRIVRRGKARVGAELATIFERLHLDAERWQQTMTLLLGQRKLVGAFAGSREQLAAIAQRTGSRWVKHRGTRGALLRG